MHLLNMLFLLFKLNIDANLKFESTEEFKSNFTSLFPKFKTNIPEPVWKFCPTEALPDLKDINSYIRKLKANGIPKKFRKKLLDSYLKDFFKEIARNFQIRRNLTRMVDYYNDNRED